jgi:hypothetical protein
MKLIGSSETYGRKRNRSSFALAERREEERRREEIDCISFLSFCFSAPMAILQQVSDSERMGPTVTEKNGTLTPGQPGLPFGSFFEPEIKHMR